MKKITVLILTSLTIKSFSQLPPYELPPYQRAIPNEGVPIAHRYLGESRVPYSQRIHRVIDSRMKQNKDITWPRNPLNQIIWHAVTTGYSDLPRPKAYANDSLATTINETLIREKVEREIWVNVQNPANPLDPNDLIRIPLKEPFDVSTITKFRIMEDWIFDAQHSDFKPTIIAIAPLYTMLSETGLELGEAALFWVKMNDLRPILAQQEVFNRRNDASRLSYDQWFETRNFASHIVKQSNVYDADINQLEEYRDNGEAALLESDEIRNDLYVLEHDLWEY